MDQIIENKNSLVICIGKKYYYILNKVYFFL